MTTNTMQYITNDADAISTKSWSSDNFYTGTY